MCGIAGYVITTATSGHDGWLRAMGEAIAHRGPDDMGFFRVDSDDGAYHLGLVHRRLSIIDLATGNQPIGNEDGQLQIMFNGEIYNYQPLRAELSALGHRFRTTSDTEVIVHAYERWGADCVQRLRGMFAFAIWDGRKNELFFARDRFGKKPLFLYQRDGVLLFGSEIKALLAVPGVPAVANQDAIWDYFAYRYVPGPATLFEGIVKLPPGHTALWRNGVLSAPQRYFSPADSQPRDPQQTLPADPVATFLDKLDESVRIRMIADVPFGAFLSGGIDSSAVVALMARHSELPVKTFSVGFKEGGFSELAYAADIARQFQTDHHELEVSVDQVIALLPDLVRFRDAPVAEPSDIPIYLLAKEARKTVKMVLTGEGSDEILGGYPKHVYEQYAQPYQRLPAWLRRGLIEPGIGALPYRFRRAKTAIINLGLETFEERMPRWFGMMSDQERAALVEMRPAARSREFGCGDSGNSALRRILCFDQTSWLPDNLLERGDRMTMAASIEARMPFMDHELAAYASTLPDHYRVRGHETKWILREAMKQLLPATILNRPKVGFRVPVNEWFRGPMKDYLYEHLTGAQSHTRGYYRPAALQKVLAEHVAGRQNHEKLLWSLLTLELWHRAYLPGRDA